MDTRYLTDEAGVRIHRRSHLDSVARCPARFHMERDMERANVPHTNQAALDRGTAVHDCLERMLKAVAQGSVQRPEEVDVDDIITQAPSDVREEVRMLVDQWLNQFGGFDQILGVEVLMDSTIISKAESPDGLAHKIGGRLDVVVADPDDHEAGHVWDWKTAWYVPPAQDLVDDLQVVTYALMASDRYGWTKVTVNLYFARWGVTRTVTFDLEAIEWADKKIHRAILEFIAWEAEAAELGDEERRPGKWCVGCPLLNSCDTPAPQVIKNQEDFEQAGGLILKNERQGPAVKAALAEYLAEQPEGTELAAGGFKFSLGLTGTQKIEDAESLAAIVIEHGEDPWKLFNIDRSKLKAAFGRRPGLEQAVSHLVVDRRKTSVVWSATGKDDDHGTD